MLILPGAGAFDLLISYVLLPLNKKGMYELFFFRFYFSKTAIWLKLIFEGE